MQPHLQLRRLFLSFDSLLIEIFRAWVCNEPSFVCSYHSSSFLHVLYHLTPNNINGKCHHEFLQCDTIFTCIK